MQSRSAWTGWIAFAGLLMIVIGFIDFFEGLIAFHATSRSEVTIDLTRFIIIGLAAGLLEFGRARHAAIEPSTTYPKPARHSAKPRSRRNRLRRGTRL